ncbi:MAG: Trk family potassium uptake protein [Clostridia bacterium]|nr:Trk family potassium uptake protein [Clostridia bacterium]
MNKRLREKKLKSFPIIILCFLGVILLGAVLLTLPVSSASGQWTSFENALFTSTSAVCVTGLIVKDTATYWSYFGQGVILALIQVGGLGVISMAMFFVTVSGRKISLFQRSMMQESIAAHQVGGIVRMTLFIFKTAFIIEVIGAALIMPSFCSEFGASGIWMAVFHSVSAFCNAGFDVMGDKSGEFSSLTYFSDNPFVIIPVCLLIIVGGIGFLTWDDIAEHKFRFKKYRMQSKVILTVSAALILIPALLFFLFDFSDYPIKKRICLSLFQAVTPRTAGFNTVDLSTMTSTGNLIIIVLMLIGGSPGSTAGGMKTTTLAVLAANVIAVIRRKKSPQMFRRRIDDQTVKSAATLLIVYIFFTLAGACIINTADGAPFDLCIFETASAVGTVGLSQGLTPSLGVVSHLVLIVLMFLGRTGGLTLMLAAANGSGVELSKRPMEKINVG